MRSFPSARDGRIRVPSLPRVAGRQWPWLHHNWAANWWLLIAELEMPLLSNLAANGGHKTDTSDRARATSCNVLFHAEIATDLQDKLCRE